MRVSSELRAPVERIRCMPMDEDTDMKRARELAEEAIGICDQHGKGLAAAHMQLGLDMITSDMPSRRVRERRTPWRPKES